MNIENIADSYIRLYRDGSIIVTNPKKCYNPDYEIQKQVKKVERVYKISKIKVRSALVNLWQAKKSKNAIFFTVTIPFEMDEKTLSVCWDRFLTNMRNNFKVNQYVWVKEYQKNGNIHYHIIIARNRIGVKKLQNTWNTIVYNVTGVKPRFNNSVRLGRNPVIYNIDSVSRYLSKYISKENSEFGSRAFGYSQDLILYRDIDPGEFEELSRKYGLKLIVNEDFFRLYVIPNYIDTG